MEGHKRGRPKKYATEEERAAHLAEYQKAYKKRKAQHRVFERLGDERAIHYAKQGKHSMKEIGGVGHRLVDELNEIQEREQLWKELSGIQVGLYSDKKKKTKTTLVLGPNGARPPKPTHVQSNPFEKKTTPEELKASEELQKKRNASYVDAYNAYVIDGRKGSLVKDEDGFTIYQPPVSKPKAKGRVAKLVNPPQPKKEEVKESSIDVAKKQLDTAQANIGTKFTIDLASLNIIGRNYIMDHLGPFLESFLESINYADHWVTLFKYSSERTRLRPLDEETKDQLHHQLVEEGLVTPGTIEYEDPFESGGNYFPYLIESLSSISFVNLKHFNIKGEAIGKGLRTLPKAKRHILADILADNDLSEDVVARLNKSLSRLARNKKQEGKFWAYVLTIPTINLERQMIFRQMDHRTTSIIEGDNCLIYACKMAGIDEDRLNHMRNIIKIRAFSLAKIETIANEVSIRFTIINEEGRVVEKGPLDGTPISLLLYKEHYMLNERIAISPCYIKHRYDIDRSKQTRYWTPQERLLTRGSSGGTFTKGTKPSYKLLKVLKTIFEVGGFKEIRYGDYMTYNSTLYASKLKEVVNLEYDAKYCCRLKGPYDPYRRTTQIDDVFDGEAEAPL